ncbi:MAG: cell division protein ZapD [Zoogloeaceae bacterium]|nr:cell division protein ZapD [Zoogloeaceae bacterium]
MIIYEHPFNERIRTLLRLESLFERVAVFTRREEAGEHHVALLSLLEILDVAGRSDLKKDMLQELERQRRTLMAFRDNPSISEESLSGVLYDIEQALAALQGLSGKFGQSLRENEWLMSIKSRAAIPGGLCEFDLPSYYYWLNQPAKVRCSALENWQKTLLPVLDALTIILRLLRKVGVFEPLCAERGQYRRLLAGGGKSDAQMARIRLPEQELAVPEISANRLVFNIRFMFPPGQEARIRCCGRDVEFQLAFCLL